MKGNNVQVGLKPGYGDVWGWDITPLFCKEERMKKQSITCNCIKIGKVCETANVFFFHTTRKEGTTTLQPAVSKTIVLEEIRLRSDVVSLLC